MRYILAILCLLVPSILFSQIKYEYYTPTANGNRNTYNYSMLYEGMCVGYKGADVSHRIDSIGIRIYRVGSPGTLTVSLYAVGSFPNYYPTGSPLSTGTRSGNTITTSTSGEMIYFNMADYEIFTGQSLYIGVTSATKNSTNYLVWLTNNTGVYECAYSWFYNGSYSTSSDDFLFEVWGRPIGLKMFDTKYKNKLRVKPYGKKYDEKNELYIYDTH